MVYVQRIDGSLVEHVQLTDIKHVGGEGDRTALAHIDGQTYPVFNSIIDGFNAIWVEQMSMEDYKARKATHVDQEKQYRLVIFDVDGTLTVTKSGATFRKTADDWQWLPGRLEKLQQLKQRGAALAIASNQGGIAFGYMEKDDMQTQLSIMCNQADIEYLYVCYAHPKASVDGYSEEIDLFDRKPSPGMIFKAMLRERVTVQETLFVGDRPEDEGAALAAGCAFEWAKNFFGDVSGQEGHKDEHA